MSMTAYALCLLDWHDPKAGNAIYLLAFLTIVTFAMVIVTIRTVYNRWRKASTEEFVSEV
jgi:type IV secretory pathway TrbD component